jgi:hypothetical protein
MSQTNIAGSGTSSNFGGTYNGVAWINPGNITSSDNVYTTASLSFTNTLSEALVAKNFGFDIAGFGTIDGIIASFERKASIDNYIKDDDVFLIKNGSIYGNNKSAGAFWSSSEGTVSFGSPSDLWGGTFSPGDINSSEFGVMINAQYQNAYNTTAIAYVDKIEITVYYSEPSIYFGTTKIKKIFSENVEITKLNFGSLTFPYS